MLQAKLRALKVYALDNRQVAINATCRFSLVPDLVSGAKQQPACQGKEEEKR